MRVSDLRFLVVLALPAFVLAGMLHRPDLMGPRTAIFFVVVALLDSFFPGARRSPAAIAENAPRHPSFRWLIRAYVPLQIAMLLVGLYVASQHSLWVGVSIGTSAGFVCGAVGITLAHELGHSKNKLDRFCAWVLMTTVGYGQFMVEHFRGHHPRAATLDDPASARRGENLYRFWLRTLTGSAASAVDLEAKRLAQLRKSWIGSPLLASVCGSLSLIAVPIALAPHAAWSIIAFLLTTWVVAVLLLETVNYIEHYGLTRNTNENGKREPFGVMHAWNADHVFSNSILINLQRHSDHHMHAWKPYETLEPLPGPQLPTGYPGAILLTLVPPVWFATMHPRLDALTHK
jgi:alkane 1-monooxygenase